MDCYWWAILIIIYSGEQLPWQCGKVTVLPPRWWWFLQCDCARGVITLVAHHATLAWRWISMWGALFIYYLHVDIRKSFAMLLGVRSGGLSKATGRPHYDSLHKLKNLYKLEAHPREIYNHYLGDVFIHKPLAYPLYEAVTHIWLILLLCD